MTTGQPQPTPQHVISPRSSGQDWADWLRQEHPSPGEAEPLAADGPPAPWAWTVLVHVARRHGFSVGPGDCGGGEAITIWPERRIRIRHQAATPPATVALAHQLGHVLLHAEIAKLEPDGIVVCRGIRALEAESVAYLVAGHAGLDPVGEDFPRVASWAGSDQRSHPEMTIQAVADRVLGAAQAVTDRLDAERIDLTPAAPSLTPAASAAPEQSSEPLEASKEDLVRVHKAALRFFHDQLPSSWVPAYLNGRGFGPLIQHQWQVGYAPAQWTALTSNLRAAGYPDSLIEASGLARRSRRGTLIDTFRDRAMLPIHSSDGTIVAFIGRASPHSSSRVPKYLNSPRTNLYDKGTELFGLWPGHSALTRGAQPVITEGPFDAIAVTMANPDRFVGVAPCGTALTSSQLARLNAVVELNTAGVLVAFDPDEPGQKAAAKAYDLLNPLTTRAEAITFPPGQDPAQLLHDRGRIALAETLAGRRHPLADLAIEAKVTRWDRWLNHAEGRIHALRAAAPVIAALPPAQVGRQIARLARRLDLDHATVTEAITDALTELVQTDRLPAHPDANPAEEEGPSEPIPPKRPDFPHPIRQATAQAATSRRPPARSDAALARRPSRPQRIPR
ncbi:MAG TPA: toprim domain-containing protein [Streptosporangiaceae bacterium]|jgi:DNA primase